MASKQPIPGRCGAKLRRKELFCNKPPCKDSNRCELHGGKSLRGPASPSWKDGKHSKYALPPKLLARYLEAEADPDLLSLRSESALFEARIREIAARFETGETASVWEELGDTWHDLIAANRKTKQAREDGDMDAAAHAQADAADAMERIGRLIKSGNRERLVWEELRDAVNDKQKVATAEHKRLIDMQSMISAEQAMAFVASVLMLVKQHVEDRSALARISDGVSRIFNVNKPAVAAVAAPAALPPGSRNITVIDAKPPSEPATGRQPASVAGENTDNPISASGQSGC